MEEHARKKSYLKSIGCGTKHVHNRRARYTNGFSCEDCGRFIDKETLEYFMTEGHSSVWMALHNRGVSFRRGESDSDISDELKELKELKDVLDDYDLLLGMSETECVELYFKTNDLLSKNNVSGKESAIILK